jgi:RNA polymerase sigma factor (sigma-70 family)
LRLMIVHLDRERKWERVWQGINLDGVAVEHEWPDLDTPALVDWLFKALDERQRFVIQQRYFEDKNLAAVAKVLRVSRERVRQIEIKAIRKMQIWAAASQKGG